MTAGVGLDDLHKSVEPQTVFLVVFADLYHLPVFIHECRAKQDVERVIGVGGCGISFIIKEDDLLVTPTLGDLDGLKIVLRNPVLNRKQFVGRNRNRAFLILAEMNHTGHSQKAQDDQKTSDQSHGRLLCNV